MHDDWLSLDLCVCMMAMACSPAGYVYLTFESEKSIKGLLMNCTCDIMDASQYYFKVGGYRTHKSPHPQAKITHKSPHPIPKQKNMVLIHVMVAD